MKQAILLENAQIIDGNGRQPFQAAVLIEGDQIVAVGADTINRGSKTTGSILIENMAIAGT